MIKELGSSSYKATAAMDSLAKTDDMLAVIGFIMLAGVIVSSYGAYWQGKYARASYKKECTLEALSANEKAKNRNYILIGLGIFLIMGAIIIFVFKRKTPEAVITP